MAKKKSKKEVSLDKSYRYLVGFDPSLDGTGYCVLDCRYKTPRIAEAGTVKGRNETWGDTPNQVKLALIQAKVKELRAKYDPIFPIVFLERGFTLHNNSTQATFRARGALEAELVGLEIVEFTPSEVKKIATGDGSASKQEVAAHIADTLGVPLSTFRTEDESDATAVAYAGYLKYFNKE
jgi:crossover junction endodeoxyribonuclease RuvC